MQYAQKYISEWIDNQSSYNTSPKYIETHNGEEEYERTIITSKHLLTHQSLTPTHSKNYQ